MAQTNVTLTSENGVSASLLLLVSLAGSVLLPIYGVSVLLLIIASARPQLAKWCAVSLVISMFVYINIHKIPSNDWLWYVRHYQYIMENGISAYFQLSAYQSGDLVSVYGVSPRISEPTFYILAWGVGVVSGGSAEALNAVVTTLVYLPIALALGALSKKVGASGISTFLIVIVGCCVGVTFPVTNHLVRQELAMALILPVMYCLWQKKYNWAIIYSLLAVSFHNSSGLLILLLCMAAFIARCPKRYRAALVAIACVSIVALLPIALGSDRVDTEKDDGSISLIVYIIDLAIIVSALLLRPKLQDEAISRIALIFGILFLVVMIMVQPTKLLYLRYYFYGDVLRCICLFFILIGARDKGIKGFAVAGLGVLFSLVYADLRIWSSAFTYTASIFDPFSRF